MNTKDWALVLFTILTEMSVGAFWVLGAVRFYANRKEGATEADRMTDRVLIAIVVTLALGFMASLFHLGNPLTAPKAVTNFATSWLSREILFGVSFAILAAIFIVLQYFKIGPFVVRNILAWIASAVGVVFIYAQANVYMLPTKPSWNSLATPISFYITTLLLGVLAIGAALVANYAYVRRKNPECEDVQCSLLREIVRWIAVSSVILVALEAIVIPAYLSSLAAGPDQGVASMAMLFEEFLGVFVLRLALVFLGAGVLALFLYRNAAIPGREQVMNILVVSAFALVLVAELMGRYLFFATQIGLGV